MDLTWHQMPQQQQRPGYGGGVGGDNAPGNEAGAGGGGGAGGGTGGEGGDPGSRGEPSTPARDPRDNPALSPTADIGSVRDAIAERTGLDAADESWDVTVTDRGLGINARGTSRAVLRERAKPPPGTFAAAFDEFFSNTTVGRVSNAIADLFGEHFDMDGNPVGQDLDALAEGGEVSTDPEKKKKPEDEEETDDPPAGTMPEFGSEEYQQRMREAAERIIGGLMPDMAFDVPDWSVVIAQDGPPAADAALQVRVPGPDMRQMAYDRAYADVLRGILEESG